MLPVRLTGTLVAMIVVLALAGPAQAQRPDAALESMPRDLVPAETLATLPPGTFLENLVFAADGSLLITSYIAREVLRFASGQGIQRHAAIGGHPLSLEPDVDGVYYVTVHGSGFRSGPEALFSSQQIWRLEPSGRAELFLKVPDAKFLNGIARLAPGVFLVTDSLAGTIWRLDVRERKVTAWLRHAALESTAPQEMRPGANGIRVVGGSVLVANSTQRRLYTIDVRNGAPEGAPKVRVEDVPFDDFAVGEDGTIFGTTHRDQVVRIRPDGSKHVIAEHADVKGNTSATLGVGPADRDKLYVVGDGGMFFGARHPPGLVRLSVGSAGATK